MQFKDAILPVWRWMYLTMAPQLGRLDGLEQLFEVPARYPGPH